MSVNCLPNEILNYCFSGLTFEELCVASCVSKQWKAVADDLLVSRFLQGNVHAIIAKCSNPEFLKKCFEILSEQNQRQKKENSLEGYLVFQRMVALWTPQQVDHLYQKITDKLLKDYGWDPMTAGRFQTDRQIHQFRYFNDDFLLSIMHSPLRKKHKVNPEN